MNTSLILPRKAGERRKLLSQHFDIARQFESIEESCVPSYVHRNILAAGVSWMRLWKAAELYRKWAPDGDILDFGCATGELRHLIEARGQYRFIEENELLVDALQKWLPDAQRTRLEDLGEKQFATVFALDSLEHNEDVKLLVERLVRTLSDQGVFILSGPTENLLYRLGRWLAGFSGHYHFQNIWNIEVHMKDGMTLLERKLVPLGVPLFSVSAWRVKR